MRTPRLLAVCLLLGLVAVLLALFWLRAPYTGFQGETFVDIARGTGTLGVGRLLENAGVVRHRWLFLLARVARPGSKVQAGEYKFDRPAAAWEVLDRLARGDIFYHELVVPEGNSVFDIAASIEKLGVISAEDFLQAARDPLSVRDLAPAARTLEGYLFPDTYRIMRHTTAEQLCRRMTDRFRQAWAGLDAALPVHEMVTLASLVEKETGLEEERPLIASVFRNRLRIDMKLDCDPTAIYAALIERRYRGAIHKSDLESTNRYNTYQHAGLPPGPIANPGLKSLLAALRPARTKYLYFVARPDGSGGHIFSSSLEEHQRAVLKYRRGSQKTKQAGAAQRVPGPDSAKSHRAGGVAGNRPAARTGV